MSREKMYARFDITVCCGVEWMTYELDESGRCPLCQQELTECLKELREAEKQRVNNSNC